MAESRQTRLQVKCPTCQTAVVWKPENAFRPFCSQRCKLIDLGGWADGKYTVSGQNGKFAGNIRTRRGIPLTAPPSRQTP